MGAMRKRDENRELKIREHDRRSVRLSRFDYSQNGEYFVTICTKNREHLFGKIIRGEMRLNDAGRMIDRWWHELENRFPDIESNVFVVMPNNVHGIIVIKNVPDSVGVRERAGTNRHPHETEIDPVGAIPCNRPVPEHRYISVSNLNSNTGTDTGTGTILNKNSGTKNLKTGEVGERAGTSHRPYDTETDPVGAPLVGALYPHGATLGNIIGAFKSLTVNEYIRRVKMKEFPRFEKSIWQRNYYEHIIRNEDEWNCILEYIEKNTELWEHDVLFSEK